MGMKKVFSDEGHIPLNLLVQVERSKLKVELCEKCNSLNKSFSELNQQMEKLEIEINSNLSLIQKQLLDGDRCSKNETRDLTKFSVRNELSQIVDALREEAIQKCSSKLRLIPPRVEIKKLTIRKKQTNSVVFKPQTTSEIAQNEPLTSSHGTYTFDYSELEGNVKRELESPKLNELSDADNDNTNYDMESEAMDDEHVNAGTVNLNDLALGTPINMDANSFVSISTISISTTKVDKGKPIINPGTGKWKCSACPIELTTKGGITRHYSSVHQKIRNRCIPCGKDFARRPDYLRHHQNVHIGMRFKCQVCNKLFTRNSALRRHASRTGCGAEMV